MKNFKKGFTLAEVLITLAIIGVVAAIVMPNLMNNNQYKTVGVKLSKFMSTTEGASRAYTAANDVLNSGESDGIEAFINDTYLINKINPEPTGEDVSKTTYTLNSAVLSDLTSPLPTGSDSTTNVAFLKDNTAFAAAACSDGEAACDYETGLDGAHKDIVNGTKTGEGAFVLSFAPLNQGLPKKVQHVYNFVVTELGFVYPAANDECLWKIYEANFVTNSKTFAKDGSCYNEASTTPSTGD